jgi:hypothetical protein
MASRPFRTLSTTESETEAASPKAKVSVQRKKSKKKKKKDSHSSGGDSGVTSAAKDDATPAMVAFLTTKDKNVSHAQIESFIHKSKVKYSVNEIRTAIENARTIGVDSVIEPGALESEAKQQIVAKWQRMIEALRSQEGAAPDWAGASGFSKSRAISIQPPKPAESSKRLKLLKDARSVNKVDRLVPNSEGERPRPETPEAHDPAPPSPSKKAPPSPAKSVKGKSKSSKKEEAGASTQTLSKDTGKKAPLPLATYKKGSKKPVLEANPIDGFYRDFKFIYVILPEPVDELPREYL